MIKKLLPYIAIAAALALASVTTAATLDEPDDSRDGVEYDIAAEKVYAGLVEGSTVRDDFVYFSLRTGDSRVDVEIGPKEFFRRSGFKLTAGATVTVLGMPAVIKGKEVVLARKVTSSDAVLVVRDFEGRPMWDPDRPMLMDPEGRSDPFDVCMPLQPDTHPPSIDKSSP